MRRTGVPARDRRFPPVRHRGNRYFELCDHDECGGHQQLEPVCEQYQFQRLDLRMVRRRRRAVSRFPRPPAGRAGPRAQVSESRGDQLPAGGQHQASAWRWSFVHTDSKQDRPAGRPSGSADRHIRNRPAPPGVAIIQAPARRCSAGVRKTPHAARKASLISPSDARARTASMIGGSNGSAPRAAFPTTPRAA